MKPASNIIWLMEILRIYLEERLLIKYCIICNIAKNPKYDRYQRGLNSMIYNLFDKTFSASHANKFTGCAVGAKTLAFQDKSAIMQNQ